METNELSPQIARMPRGGPNASWLDRRLQTDVVEYTDRYDVADEVKQTVITALDRMGDHRNQHETNAHLALELVAGIANPRILELGAGHGRLSAKILELHDSARVTVSDLDPTSVANIAAGPLGHHPRARVEVIDATALDADDASYDLVVFAMAFHHLPPEVAVRTIAEATRVGRQFLVVDLKRPNPLSALLLPLMAIPATVAVLRRPSTRHVIHDGVISVLRAYSTAALRALGEASHPATQIESIAVPARFGLGVTATVFSRPRASIVTDTVETDPS